MQIPLQMSHPEINCYAKWWEVTPSSPEQMSKEHIHLLSVRRIRWISLLYLCTAESLNQGSLIVKSLLYKLQRQPAALQTSSCQSDHSCQLYLDSQQEETRSSPSPIDISYGEKEKGWVGPWLMKFECHSNQTWYLLALAPKYTIFKIKEFLCILLQHCTKFLYFGICWGLELGRRE